MDTEAAKQKMSQLKTKARGARKAGSAQVAKAFQTGAKRLQRRLQRLNPKKKEKKAE